MKRCPNCNAFIQDATAALCPTCKHSFEAGEERRCHRLQGLHKSKAVYRPSLRRYSALVAVAGACLTLALTSCAPRHKVYRLTAPAGSGGYKMLEPTCGLLRRPCERGAVLYSLPRTVVGVTVPITRTEATLKRCTLRAIAENDLSLLKLLKSLDVLTDVEFPDSTAESFLVVKSNLGDVTVETFGEPDPAQLFAVNVGPRFVNRVDTTLELTPTGLLAKGSAAIENIGLKLSLKTVELGFQLAAAAAGAAVSSLPTAVPSDEAELAHCWRRAQLAKRLNDERGKARELLQALTADGKPTAEVHLRIDALTVQRDALIDDSFQSVKILKGALYCEHRPVEGGDELLIASLNQSSVVAPIAGADCQCSPNVCGKPVQKDQVKNRDDNLSLRVEPLPSAISASLKVEPSSNPNGMYFRIPAPARLVVSGPKINLSRKVVVAQFGTTTALPSRTGSLFGGTATLDLDSTSGAVLKLSTLAAAPDTEGLEAIGAATVGLLAARVSSDAAEKRKEEMKKDPATSLEMEKRLLELERDICTLRKQLGLPTDCVLVEVK